MSIPNPVIPGFHPDPSVCQARLATGADRYYLACSSFEYFPGVPIFESDDLVTWRQIGNALDRPEQLRLTHAPASAGVYAPTLRHHDGRFWLVTTNVSTEGHLIVTATDPAGPWSDPVVVTEPAGIDPDLAWDEAGTCWLTCAHAGGIWQVRIDPTTGATLSEPTRLWSGTGLAWPEAPHLYNVDGVWYLLIAEGGTERGHAVSVARGPAPDGPFEGHPGNPVLSHRSLPTPVQSTGHADLVRGPAGDWWMVLLGSRPLGFTPGYHVLGRETFLTPVTWTDGWPVPHRVELGTTPTDVGWHDDFDTDRLAPQWISLREPARCSLTERPGWLTLHARDSSLDDLLCTFVGRRQQAHAGVVRALVDASAGRGGLVVRRDERHWYAVESDGVEVRVIARIGPLVQVVAAVPAAGPAELEIRFRPAGDPFHEPPDVISLGYRGTELAELDGRYLSTEVAGGFTGRVVGAYATAGTVAVDWMRGEFPV